MTHQEKITLTLALIDPKKYEKSRNYVDGAVTELGPYISRGVIDTRFIWEYLLKKGYDFDGMFGLVQQLAWRDFFQRIWQQRGEGINQDIRGAQLGVIHGDIPAAIAAGISGIQGIDQGIQRLITTGRMHNHVRMYTAFLSCNFSGAHWRSSAQWMYSNLLDGDWGSNALSWQWVAGTFSNKKYIANQDNINRYTSTEQRDTYLDCSYEELATAPVPEVLKAKVVFELKTPLPAMTYLANDKKTPISPAPLQLEPDQPLLIYNYYNLSPQWRISQRANRVLLLEPSHFEKYPVAQHCVDFMMSLAKEIPGLRVYVGEFDVLAGLVGDTQIIYREHPLNQHYYGTVDERTWLVPNLEGDFSSFFSFWKKAEKSLRREFNNCGK